jgi:glycosyltransferase involved in cell wall biosynthesis
MKPTISVITPSFNQGQFIEKTIQSVLSQNIEDLEYFIADGGSSDETIKILNRYGDQIRWVSEPDHGQADGVNKGIMATYNDIIGWLNSDDVYYPGALKVVQSHFSADPNLMVLYGDADHIDTDDSVIESYQTKAWDYEHLKEVCYLCQPAVFFRREAVSRYGMLDPALNYCMDYEYWLRLGKHVPFKHVAIKLAGSRFYAENKTLQHRMPVHREINDMMLAKFNEVPTKWIFNYAHTVADSKFDDNAGSSDNLQYLHILILESINSFIRWKKIPSASDLRTLSTWVAKFGRLLKEGLRRRGN